MEYIRLLDGVLVSSQPEEVKGILARKFIQISSSQEHAERDCAELLSSYTKLILTCDKNYVRQPAVKAFQEVSERYGDAFLRFLEPSMLTSLFTSSENVNRIDLIGLVITILSTLGRMSNTDTPEAEHVAARTNRIIRAHLPSFLRRNGPSNLSLASGVSLLYSLYPDTTLPDTEEGLLELASLTVSLLAGYRALSPDTAKEFRRDTNSLAKVIDLLHQAELRLLTSSPSSSPHSSSFSSFSPNCRTWPHTLKEIYERMSDSGSEGEPGEALCFLIEQVPVSYMAAAATSIVEQTETEAAARGLEQALTRLINFLTIWPSPHLADWVLQILRAVKHPSTLTHVAEETIVKLGKSLVTSIHREQNADIFFFLLYGYQHKPTAFHKVVKDLPMVLDALRYDNETKNRLTEAIVYMMGLFPSYPGMYSTQLLSKVSGFSISEERKDLLRLRGWVDGGVNSSAYDLSLSITSPLSTQSHFVGLMNLDNTCYMNSVLQGLYMAKLFSESVLAQGSVSGQPILRNLQTVFGFLKYSQRTIFSPKQFYKIARPSWFDVGRQQDCAEFLIYLLDTLHEEEKSILSLRQSETNNKSQLTGEVEVARITVTELDRISEQPENASIQIMEEAISTAVTTAADSTTSPDIYTGTTVLPDQDEEMTGVTQDCEDWSAVKALSRHHDGGVLSTSLSDDEGEDDGGSVAALADSRDNLNRIEELDQELQQHEEEACEADMDGGSIEEEDVHQAVGEDGGRITAGSGSRGSLVLSRWTTEENLSISDSREQLLTITPGEEEEGEVEREEKQIIQTTARETKSEDEKLFSSYSNSTDSGIQSVGESAHSSQDKLSENHVDSPVDQTLVQRLFGLTVESALVCDTCHKTSRTRDFYRNIGLSVPSVTSSSSTNPLLKPRPDITAQTQMLKSAIDRVDVDIEAAGVTGGSPTDQPSSACSSVGGVSDAATAAGSVYSSPPGDLESAEAAEFPLSPATTLSTSSPPLTSPTNSCFDQLQSSQPWTISSIVSTMADDEGQQLGNTAAANQPHCSSPVSTGRSAASWASPPAHQPPPPAITVTPPDSSGSGRSSSSNSSNRGALSMEEEEEGDGASQMMASPNPPDLHSPIAGDSLMSMTSSSAADLSLSSTDLPLTAGDLSSSSFVGEMSTTEFDVSCSRVNPSDPTAPSPAATSSGHVTATAAAPHVFPSPSSSESSPPPTNNDAPPARKAEASTSPRTAQMAPLEDSSSAHASTSYGSQFAPHNPMTSNLSVADLLVRYLEDEKFEGENQYECDYCNRKTDATKTTRILTAPHFLILTLNRFEYDRKNGRRVKVFTQIQYPQQIQIPVQGSNNSTELVQYGLYCVIVHSGFSSDGGHYYSWAKDSARGETWRIFNDSVVTLSSWHNFREQSKRLVRDTPYVLFYQREDKTDRVQDVAPPQHVVEAVARDNQRFQQEKQGVNVQGARSGQSDRKDDGEDGRGGGGSGRGCNENFGQFGGGRFVC